MATPLTGLNGVLLIEGAEIASMRSITVTIGSDPQEIGGFGSPWERQKPGRKTVEGSAEGVWAYGDSAGQGAVLNAIRNDTLVTLAPGPDSTHTFTIEAYITSYELNVEFDGIAGLSFDFVGDGEPTGWISHA